MGKRSDPEAGYRTHKSRQPPPHFCPPPPKTWFPWLVPLIFVANVAEFCYTMYYNNCPATSGIDNCMFYQYLGRLSFEPFKINHFLGPSTTTLEQLGGLERKLVVQDGEWWRLFSCMWLHAGFIHLVINMASLLFIGIRLEQEFGFLRIGILYVLSGFGGSLMSAIFQKQNVSVGASGALFGLLGAMFSEFITNWTIYTNKCAALFSMLVVIGLNLALGFIPGVDSSAHFGGFFSGLCVGFFLLVRPQFGYVSRKYIPEGYEMKHTKSKYKLYQYILAFMALVILLVGYAIGLTKLFNKQAAATE